MFIFLRMTTISLGKGFPDTHICTNDYPFLLNGFSSCTCLYEWLSISFEWVFVMSMFVRMTIHFLVNGFPSCTCLYGWLSISFEWVFVMYISVRMITFSFWMDFRHVHFCTDDYLLSLNEFSSYPFLSDDYILILNGFSSCTFLYEWLPFLF